MLSILICLSLVGILSVQNILSIQNTFHPLSIYTEYSNSIAEEIALAETGPLKNCVLRFTLPDGYAIKEVEERYDKYWSIDIIGPPTIETSKTQKWQEPQTYESVPDTMTINVRIGTLSMTQPNMTAIARYGTLAITEIYEEGDAQINGHKAHHAGVLRRGKEM